MKSRIYVLLAMVLATAALPLQAEVYKIIDDQGRVTYTDTVPAKDQKHEKVELKPINSQAPVEPRRDYQFTPAESDDAPVNYTLALSAPANETHVPPGQRDLLLAAQVNPGLQAGDRIQFLMNGQPVGPASQTTSHLIEEIYRGEHSLSVKIIDSRGKTLATSKAVTVYVHRPGLNSPRRNAPN